MVKVVLWKTFFLRAMTNFTFTLEKYHGTNSRHTCPNCNTRREFSRYIDANGNHLAADVGKCNRESKCGYHFTPKQHFSLNPTQKRIARQGYVRKKQPESLKTQKSINFIDFELLKQTLGNYEQNSFVRFLTNLFTDELEAIQAVLQKYAVGTWKDNLSIFWQIDRHGKIRTGKLMRFDLQTGKRQAIKSWIENGETRQLKAYWMHKELIKQKELHADFNLKQCFFGEHLLPKYPNKPVAIVEAEKTALICAIRFPEMLWLAVGAKGYLQTEKFQVFSGRKVLLFPDADAYSDWKEKVARAQRNGFDVRISSLIETHGAESEKQSGFDLADYLISEIKQKTKAKTAYESLVRNPQFNGWTNASLF